MTIYRGHHNVGAVISGGREHNAIMPNDVTTANFTDQLDDSHESSLIGNNNTVQARSKQP